MVGAGRVAKQNPGWDKVGGVIWLFLNDDCGTVDVER